MIINYINNMTYLEITFWILIGYIVSIIVGRILFYSAAILHDWCMMATWNNQYWYDRGTTIKDIYNSISNGDNFKSGNEMKFVPIGNILFPLVWVCGELMFLCIVVIISIIRLIIIIVSCIYTLVWEKCLSKLFKPIFNYLDSIDIDSKDTWIDKIIASFKKYKQFILNIRIA